MLIVLHVLPYTHYTLSIGTMSCSTETVTAAAVAVSAVVAVGGGVEGIEGGEKVAVVVAVVVVVVVAVVVAVMVVLGDGRVARGTDVVPKVCRRRAEGRWQH
jgi:hypothetical protein